MAPLLLRIHRRQNPLLRRAFSSTSTSGDGPFPPPSSDPAPADERANLSTFAGIRSSLNSSPPAASPPRRIPISPPRPAGAGSPPPPPPPAATTHDDVRRSLNLFRNPQPSSAAAPNPKTPSFVDIFRNSPTAPPTGSAAAAAPSAFPFAALRESLSKMGPVPGAGAAKHLGWGSNLSRLPQRQNGKPPLPESIFGREMRGQMGKGHGDKVVVEEEFIPCYSYDELGKRLSELRPAPAPAAGKDMKEWFSVEELSQRLKRLREMDKEERGRALQSGMGTGLLRKAIVSLKDQEKTNNLSAAQIMPVLVGFGSREATPAYMLRKPQNELVERYFHPDHMSSAEKMKLELQRVRDEFKMSENDCGSARVQVAQLTTKIKHLSVTLHKKDKHSRKGLQEMVQRRKKYLKYLRRTDWDSYCLVLSKLGLRDVPEYKPPDYKNKSSSSSSKTKAKRKSKRKMKA